MPDSNDSTVSVTGVERSTAAIPWGATECAWAQCRPGPHRTPTPEPGDVVYYRHNKYEVPVLADVLWVQPLDDIDDPNVWRVQLDAQGDPVLIDGRPIFQKGFDPWPLLRLRVPGLNCLIETREARLRGSPGWLPLDWTTKYRPLPGV